jgi:hypothetical protein
MEKLIKYLKKKIKKYSGDIAYMIVIGIPFFILVLYLGKYLNLSELY